MRSFGGKNFSFKPFKRVLTLGPPPLPPPGSATAVVTQIISDILASNTGAQSLDWGIKAATHAHDATFHAISQAKFTRIKVAACVYTYCCTSKMLRAIPRATILGWTHFAAFNLPVMLHAMFYRVSRPTGSRISICIQAKRRQEPINRLLTPLI